jgi:hypothetical protein
MSDLNRREVLGIGVLRVRRNYEDRSAQGPL